MYAQMHHDMAYCKARPPCKRSTISEHGVAALLRTSITFVYLFIDTASCCSMTARQHVPRLQQVFMLPHYRQGGNRHETIGQGREEQGKHLNDFVNDAGVQVARDEPSPNALDFVRTRGPPRNDWGLSWLHRYNLQQIQTKCLPALTLCNIICCRV